MPNCPSTCPLVTRSWLADLQLLAGRPSNSTLENDAMWAELSILTLDTVQRAAGAKWACRTVAATGAVPTSCPARPPPITKGLNSSKDTGMQCTVQVAPASGAARMACIYVNGTAPWVRLDERMPFSCAQQCSAVLSSARTVAQQLCLWQVCMLTSRSLLLLLAASRLHVLPYPSQKAC